MPVSQRIRDPLRAGRRPFHANDNIARHIKPEEMLLLLEEVTRLADLLQDRMQPDGVCSGDGSRPLLQSMERREGQKRRNGVRRNGVRVPFRRPFSKHAHAHCMALCLVHGGVCGAQVVIGCREAGLAADHPDACTAGH